MRVSRLVAAVSATAALGGVFGASLATVAESAASPQAIASKACGHSSTLAVINRKVDCLHSGEYCSHRYESQYVHYGYTCKVVRGVYRLERRT